MDTSLIFGIILIVAGLATLVGSFFVKSKPEETKYVKANTDGAKSINPNCVKQVEYFFGGGEMGDYYRLTLKFDNSLKREKCLGNGCEEESDTFKVAQDYMDEVEEEVLNYSIRTMKELPRSEEFALDASYATLSVSFVDGENIHINTDTDVLTDEQIEGFNKIVEILEQAVSEHRG